MSVKLDFEIIKEIVAHGAQTSPGLTADPSTSALLKSLGTGLVTPYLEQLSLLNIVGDPEPIYGQGGGMWIGYRLTERGRSLAESQQELRVAVAELTGDGKTETAQSVVALRQECLAANMNANYKEEFLHTLDEIAICFDDDCYMAAIGLCGKVLEVCLKEILIRHNIDFDPILTIGTLLKTVKAKVPSEYVDPSLDHIGKIINESRITAVHAKERIPIPSRDQAIMVISAMRDVVRRNITHYVRAH